MDRALALIAPHCDIEERLARVPPSARVRGIGFRSIKTVLARTGKIEAYFDLFGPDPHGAMTPYPLGDYMLRLAVAGAILRSPAEALQGTFDISRENARELSNSMLGKMLIRLLAKDPVRLCEQGLAMRRQTFLYGHWELIQHGPRHIEMVYRDEPIWIEHSVAGAALGSFEACGISPRLETVVQDRWNGSTHIQW